MHEHASLADELQPLLGTESVGVCVVSGRIELVLECKIQLLEEGREGGGEELGEELVHGYKNRRLYIRVGG